MFKLITDKQQVLICQRVNNSVFVVSEVNTIINTGVFDANVVRKNLLDGLWDIRQINQGEHDKYAHYFPAKNNSLEELF